MHPVEVPDEMVEALWRAAGRAEVDIPAGAYRQILAIMLPEHEAMVRERVAVAIEANPMGECSGAVAECARIARGGAR
jgi:hypothetical protein